MMRVKNLRAFTIVEGIVSMVILSLLLSVSLIIAFNVYKSFPSNPRHALETNLHFLLDSLAENKITEQGFINYRSYNVSVEVSPFYTFDQVSVLHCTITDSLGRTVSNSKLVLRDEE